MDSLNQTALADGTYLAYVAGDSGPCSGPGACAYRLFLPNGEVVEKTRLSENTTSPKAALVGAIAALRVTPEGAIVTIVSDLDYLIVNGAVRLEGWSKNGWRNTKGKPIKNVDLWKMLYALMETRTVTFQGVEGDDDALNIREVKALARKGVSNADRKYIASLKRGT